MGQVCCHQNSEIQDEQSQPPKFIMEQTLNNIIIRLTHGNIIDEDVDAVLAISDLQFNITSILSNKILKMGGRQMKDDFLNCQRNKQTIQFGDVIHTHAQELEFDFVFFALLPSDYELDYDIQLRKKMKSFICDESLESSIQEYQEDNKQYVQSCIKKTLMLSNDLGLSSISFPVIIQESQINSKCYIALIMLLAIKQFIEEKHIIKNLSIINITIADKNYIKPFKYVLNRLTNGKQIIDYYETPQLGPQEEIIKDSFENEIVQFGQRYKDRSNGRNKYQDSI